LEIVTAPDRPRPPVEVFDFSLLNADDNPFEIDTGVTSGADSASWDDNSVDDEGRVDSCDANGAGAGAGGAAICHTEKDQNKDTKK
jgi:hypothetical protein